MVLYSGHEEKDAPHTQGVALMLPNEVRNTLIRWKSHGPRITKSSSKTKKSEITVNVIQCYTPANDRNDDDKDQFNKRLQSIVAKRPGKDLTIPKRDLNAKVGLDNIGYEDIMG
ncbi:unnamed protein product [Schistosoma mattheei]|uniref:Uncharacterized protein n=1 Tax=Schistosoma mattheei TaxID=31246 RepID=A0A183NYD3_9TREM|nr:unnamed protein product [Schistosoma mattheei]